MTSPKNQKTPEGSFAAYVDSVKQAVAEFERNGISVSRKHLERAKIELGEKAFKGSRIHFTKDLFDWLDANPEEQALPEAPEDDDVLESKDVLERRKLREQFLKARHARLVEEKQFISLAEFKERATQTIAQFRASFNGLRTDCPQWSGMPAHEILKRVTDKTDNGFRELESFFRKMAVK